MWYICLFPLILPSSKITLFWRGISLILAWVAGQVRKKGIATWVGYSMDNSVLIGYMVEFRIPT
jgi:hypothetical protein